MKNDKWVKNTRLFPGDEVNLKFDLLGVTFEQKSKNISI